MFEIIRENFCIRQWWYNALIKKKGMTKKEFADFIGKSPSEVTKWLSGQHNFTIRTLAMLSAYFDETLIVPA